jgi:hypothetical protein
MRNVIAHALTHSPATPEITMYLARASSQIALEFVFVPSFSCVLYIQERMRINSRRNRPVSSHLPPFTTVALPNRVITGTSQTLPVHHATVTPVSLFSSLIQNVASTARRSAANYFAYQRIVITLTNSTPGIAQARTIRQRPLHLSLHNVYPLSPIHTLAARRHPPQGRFASVCLRLSYRIVLMDVG